MIRSSMPSARPGANASSCVVMAERSGSSDGGANAVWVRVSEKDAGSGDRLSRDTLDKKGCVASHAYSRDSTNSCTLTKRARGSLASAPKTASSTSSGRKGIHTLLDHCDAEIAEHHLVVSGEEHI